MKLSMSDTANKILIIDPDDKDREELAVFLIKENYFVETGRGFRDAIKKIPSGNFNCLIMDVKLPEMKGYEAVSILKSLDPKIKVIMTTKKIRKALKQRSGNRIYFSIS